MLPKEQLSKQQPIDKPVPPTEAAVESKDEDLAVDSAGEPQVEEDKEKKSSNPWGCIICMILFVGFVFLTIWWWGWMKQHRWWEILLVWLGLTIVGIPIGEAIKELFKDGDKK